MTDIALIEAGAVAQVWRNSELEAVLPTLPEGDHDLVAFDAGAVRCGMLFDGEALSEPPAPPAPPRRVAKGTIADRLQAAGLSEAFMAALTARPAFMLTWITPATLGVLVTNADLLDVLDAIGADAETILAA